MLMDEPFGALDPITRTRLQNELLRIQGELRKTIIFVTHDIDEAILVGDRIAILREGGVLVQYDTPERAARRPGRRLRRPLRRRRPRPEAALADAARRARARAARTAPSGRLLDGETTLRDALSAMLNDGARAVVVEDGDGTKRQLTLDRLTELLR